MTDEDDPRLSFIPLKTATTPPGGLIRHFKDHYWIMHPTKGLVFYKTHSPQCNTNIDVVKQFIDMYPWAIIVFVPSVFERINPKDYV